MPYMEIYKSDTDDKYHQYDCEKLNKKKIYKHIRIGTNGEPDPPYEDMCKICFKCLFKEK